jgi:hypothetical protein
LSALPLIRFFRLSEDGVHCGADGLHIGAAPLLCRAASGGWAVRPRDEAEAELTALHGLPIDLSGKAGGLATVAGARDRGDAALAAIAAVLLGLPDPPGLAKSPVAATIEKFGRAVLDDPSNIVWVPTLKHEQITGYYNLLESENIPSVRHRDVVNELDFLSQRDTGLDTLRLFGVLQ